ncbi:IS1595 family transposase [Massilia sp. Leaf139]|uniref:IS1595 family transposase n=1 Tax=Massilia sp. Leaf139 TaxID=1736272 RepID=UPI0006FD23EF|nr:IS1595 family transposase [Massilia sp. Leaf139]KQQ91644.1 transposase [Massilia sp. Leaf139]
MQARKFEQILTDLKALTRRQRERLLALLRPAVELDKAVGLIESARARELACAHCQSRQLYRHGRAHGLQRYRCKNCGRTCNALTGTALARLRHKGRWLDYLGGMLDSRSIRRSAADHGVAGATSFRWRHRFLDVSKHDRPQCLAGIAEADEMYMLESHKGSRQLDRAPRKRGGKATKRGISNEQMCILVARDRTGQTLDWIPGKGALTHAQLHQHLLPRLERDVLLVSDAHAAYRSFARRAGITHEAVNLQAGVRVRGAIHVQNVNAYHSRLRGWLLPFRGVASRYLSNYLGWRWALDGGRIATPEDLLRAALGAGRSVRFHT